MRPVLLLIPGMLNTARIWSRVTPLLQDQADIRIANVTTQTRIADMARDTWALVADVPAAQKLVLGGFSMGGYVVLELIGTYLISNYPSRTWATALINTSARAETADGMLARDKTIQAAERDFERVMQGIAQFGFHKDHHPDAALMAETLSIMREAGLQAAVRQLHAIKARADQRALLPRIQARALVVSSRGDAVVPPAMSEEMAALLPNATLEWLEPAGHMTPLEQPAALANLLRTLL